MAPREALSRGQGLGGCLSCPASPADGNRQDSGTGSCPSSVPIPFPPRLPQIRWPLKVLTLFFISFHLFHFISFISRSRFFVYSLATNAAARANLLSPSGALGPLPACTSRFPLLSEIPKRQMGDQSVNWRPLVSAECHSPELHRGARPGF